MLRVSCYQTFQTKYVNLRTFSSVYYRKELALYISVTIHTTHNNVCINYQQKICISRYTYSHRGYKLRDSRNAARTRCCGVPSM